MRAAFVLVAAGLAALALWAAPGGEAQTMLSMNVQEPDGFLAPQEANQLYVNVTVSCLFMLTSGGEAEVIVDAVDPPEWLEVLDGSATLSLTECDPGTASVTRQIVFSAEPSRDAPGFEPFDLEVQARAEPLVGDDATASGTFSGLVVDYLPGHTVTPSGDQTFDVEGHRHEFDIQIEVTANARTMVMFEDRVVEGPGTVTGLRAVTFDVEAGDRSRTLPIEFAASPPWTESSITFTEFSHCLDGPTCPNVLETRVTWTFVNADPDAPGTDPEDEDSPAAGVLLAAAVLAGAVLLAARRRRL